MPSTKSFNVSETGSKAVGYLTCRIHSVAIVSILDADIRRPDGASRTIGTLLGFVTEGNIIEITDAFPVPHQDAEERNVLMDQDYHRTMANLINKVPPKENVVGWYSTGAEITESSVIINSFYNSQESGFARIGGVLESPLHLLVNTADIMKTKSLPINAYIHQETKVADNLARFHEIPSEIVTDEPDGKMALKLIYPGIMKNAGMRVDEPGGKRGISASTANDLLDQQKLATEYVEDVKRGKIRGDPSFGREILRIPSPDITETDERSGEESVSMDPLVMKFLSQMVQVQLGLSGKLNDLTPLEQT